MDGAVESGGAEDIDVTVSRGHLRAHRFGPPAAGHLVICVPGISANSRWFTFIAQGLAAGGHHVVALDLRGRGYSSVTRPGTYGLRNHALDIYEVARTLGATSFDVVGHSMGAYVGMEAAALRNDIRLRRLVLIDGLGVPRLSAVISILRALDRLGRYYDSREAYVAHVRTLGLVQHWNAYWERAYAYELLENGGRVRSRTQRAPVFEDVAYGFRHDARRLWRALEMPVLTVRAMQPLAGRTGYIVPDCDVRNFARIAPRVTSTEIPANHYDIVMHDKTLSEIRGFLHAD